MKKEKINLVDENGNLTLDFFTQRILEAKKAIGKNIFEIGKNLCAVKEMLDYGEFIKYLEETVSFTRQTANKFMKVYTEISFEEYIAADGKSTLQLEDGIEKLYLIATIPEEKRIEFTQNNNIKTMSVRDIKSAIKEIKNVHKKPIELQKTEPIEIQDVTEPINIGEDSFDIWVDTIRLKNEIIMRTGSFYTNINSNLKLKDAESLLITRYLNDEVTHNQLKQVIEDNNLNIPYMPDEGNYKKFIYDLDISNSYSHLEEVDGKYDTYYSVLEIKDLSYKNVVEFAWETNELERQGYIEDNKYYFANADITVAKGWVENYEYICIYKDKQLFAHYKVDCDYFSNIKELFKFYKINKKYLELVEKFMQQQENDKREQQEEDYKRAVNKAKFKFIEGKETYLLSEYGTQRDYVRVFVGYEEVATYVFDIGMNLYNKDFYNAVSMETYVNELIKKADAKHITLVHILKFYKKLKEKAKVAYDQYKNAYDNFNWDDLNFDFKNEKSNDANIDIFTFEEKKLLKEVLTNEKIAKKLYQLAAMEYHPDKVATKGKEVREQAENKMKLLNAINDKIAG